MPVLFLNHKLKFPVFDFGLAHSTFLALQLNFYSESINNDHTSALLSACLLLSTDLHAVTVIL